MIPALIARVRGVHSDHKRIASGALYIGLLVLVAKLFVAAREIAIAWRYGISGTVDAYQLALTITTWLPMMLAGVATVVLVPRLVAIQRHAADYRSFVAELNGGFLLTGLTLVFITWLAAPSAAGLLAGGLHSDIVSLTKDMARPMAPLAFLVLTASYLTARLQARERFGYSAAEALPALTIILFIVAAPDAAAASPLVWGTLLGFMIQFAVLGVMVHRGSPPLGGLRFRHRSPQWATLYGPLLLMSLGQIFITLVIPVDQAFAARIGEGAVATLGYANRIITLVSGFGSVVLARALLPVLSGAATDGRLELGRRQTLQWAAVMGALATSGAALGWLLSPFVVELLFERGAFGAAETARVAEVLRWGMLQFPPFFVGIVLVQWYAATGRYRTILIVTALAFSAKVAINFVAVGPLGVSGLMVGSAAMYAVTAVLMALALTRSKAWERRGG